MGFRELSSQDVDHTWLWKLNPRRGSILHADEYADAVRFRLGCVRPVEPAVCAACNTGLHDTGALHASCCALSEATHPSAETEVPGLIPGTECPYSSGRLHLLPARSGGWPRLYPDHG